MFLAQFVNNERMQTLYQNNLRHIANARDNVLIPSKKSFLTTLKVANKLEVYIKNLKVIWQNYNNDKSLSAFIISRSFEKFFLARSFGKLFLVVFQTFIALAFGNAKGMLIYLVLFWYKIFL